MSNRLPKRFVLPYDPEYTAHRDDERAFRITQLHLHAREHVLAPPTAPEIETREFEKIP